MQAKMEPCIYLGYDCVHNCSRVYRLRQRDVIATRDVKYRPDSFAYARALQQGTVQEILNGRMPNVEHEDADDEVEMKQQNADEDTVVESDVPAPNVVRSPIFSRSQGGRLQRVRAASELEDIDEEVLEVSPSEYERKHDSDENDSDVAESKSNESPHARPASNSEMNPDEMKAIEDALANSALEAACATPSGMHQLEQETPRTYKQVLLSKRRND